METWGERELAALGRVVVNFAELEWCAERLLAGFVSEGGLVATLLVTGEAMSWKLEKLSAIAIESDSETTRGLRDWVKATRILNERRNQIMHSLFVLAEGGESTMRMKATTRGGRWRAHAEPMDPAVLNDLADLLHQGTEAADALVQQLRSYL